MQFSAIFVWSDAILIDFGRHILPAKIDDVRVIVEARLKRDALGPRKIWDEAHGGTQAN
jgi:hypothetical protein